MELVQIQPSLPVPSSTSQQTQKAVKTVEQPSVLAEDRASSYVIYVDLPDEPDEMLLVHGYTGAFDKVSKDVATYLRSRELRSAPKPLYGAWTPEKPLEGPIEAPSDEILGILRRRGYLTRMGYEKEETLLERIALKMHEVRSRVPNYIFMPTYSCNLRCAYCFQDHMRTDPRYRHLLRLMSLEMVDRVFKGIFGIEAAHGISDDSEFRRNIGFYGGEPFLKDNFRVVEHIINKALSLGPATFWAVSNATELDAYRPLLSRDKLSNIQVTIDGTPGEHNRRRIYEDGSGSFERIARNISMALDMGVSISIRLNIDRRNVGTLPELAEIFASRGWTSYPNFGVYTAAVRSYSNKKDVSECMGSWELDKELARLQTENAAMSIFAAPDDEIKQQSRRIFRDGGNTVPTLRESFCSAHSGMYIFDPFGDIYACWEKTGDPSIRVGHVQDDGTLEMNSGVSNLWRSRTVASNPVCGKCRYALHCGGGCAVLAHRNTGDYHTNFCDSFSSRFRSNVAQAYVEHISGRAFVEQKGRVCDQ